MAAEDEVYGPMAGGVDEVLVDVATATRATARSTARRGVEEQEDGSEREERVLCMCCRCAVEG
jgi:hypothetical protein